MTYEDLMHNGIAYLTNYHFNFLFILAYKNRTNLEILKDFVNLSSE